MATYRETIIESGEVEEYEEYIDSIGAAEYFLDILNMEALITEEVSNLNQSIDVINNIRHSEFKDEIEDLYKFLTKYKDVGSDINGYNYVHEDLINYKVDYDEFLELHLENRWVVPEELEELDELEPVESLDVDDIIKIGATGVGIAAAAVLMPWVTVPAIIGGGIGGVAGGFLDGLFNGGDDDDDESAILHKNVLKIYSEYLEDIYDEAKEVNKIIIIFRECIDDISRVITKRIIPELEGIDALMRNMEFVNEITTGGSGKVTAKSLVNTNQHCHLIFIQNTMDFYRVILEFFTSKVITELFDGEKDVFEKGEVIEAQVKEIDTVKNALIESKYFGEVNG